MELKFSGRYTAELRSPDGRLKQTAIADNIITDAGLNWYLTNVGPMTGYYSPLRYIGVGTGSSVPSGTDTSLQSQVGARQSWDPAISNGLSANTSNPDAPYVEFATVFDGNAANANLTEVGTFYDPSGGVMWSRALFTTDGGSPVVINKQQGDILTVRYRLTMSRSSQDPFTAAITDSRSNTYSVSGILTNSCLAGLLQSDRWTGNFCRSYRAGNDNTTPPSATQTSVHGSVVGSWPNDYSWTAHAAHTGPSGGFYREVSMPIATSYCNGEIKELFFYGIDTLRSNIMSGLCIALKFSNAGAGMIKTSSDILTLKVRLTFTR